MSTGEAHPPTSDQEVVTYEVTLRRDADEQILALQGLGTAFHWGIQERSGVTPSLDETEQGMEAAGEVQGKMPVSTWEHHEISGLPMCWLFGQWSDKGNFAAAITYDGTKYRLYEGEYPYPKKGALLPVEGVEIYGRRHEERNDDDERLPADLDAGVDLLLIKDGVVKLEGEIDNNDIEINSGWGWRRQDTDEVVQGAFGPIGGHRIVITPEQVTIEPRPRN